MDPAGLARLTSALEGRYRFDRELGRGGSGTVFLAQDLARKRPVAIKLMMVGSGFLACRERFLREIEVEAALVHPHIVPVFDSGEVEDVVYFVMPFIDGESLQIRLSRDGPLPVREALRLAREVGQALAHAHAHRVIHRDVKPGNILLSSGHALVADFGIARVLDARLDTWFRTTDAVGVGTPAYMAPEQAQGSEGIDGRADQYSLGCVLFEMLVGRVPFAGRDFGEVLRRHAADTVPPIRSARPAVAADVEAIVMRAMAKVPADRYPAMADMVEALQLADLAEGGSAPRPVPRRPHRAHWIGATLLAVTTLGATTGLLAKERARARLVDRADSTRIVVFPLESDASIDVAADARLRRALASWQGISVTEPFSVREAIGVDALTSTRANAIALRFRSGRYMRGTVTAAGAGLELRLVLTAAGRRPLALHEEVIRVPRDEHSLDSAFAHLVERSLIREPRPPDLRLASLSTASVPAMRAYLRGRDAVTRWQVDSAIDAFDEAWATDRRFGSAALWLALTKYWNDAPTAEWTLAALTAARDSGLLATREAGAARALVATTFADLPTACRHWDALTLSHPFDFMGWYGAAICRDRDERLVRAEGAPSGYAFRSSYQTALARYLRAYQLLPTMHRSLSRNAFERVRRQMFVSSSFLRRGETANGEVFLASPSLDADTLVFLPHPELSMYMADPAVLRDEASQRRVERRQRELFRDVARMWASADRRSSEAREAYALALQLIGDVSALDTITAAKSLEGPGERWYRLTATEAWLRVGFAVPDDWSALRRARALADTVLAGDTSESGADVRATLAALTGKQAWLLRQRSRTRGRLEGAMPSAVADAASDLTVIAAFGGSPEAIARAESRVDSLIVALAPEPSRDSVRGMAYARAARLAWASAPLSHRNMATVDRDYLVPALLSASRDDAAALAPAILRIRGMRSRVTPAYVSLDALLPEAALLVRVHDLPLAAVWLDEALGVVRTTTPDFDAIKAAALVRSMALRAEIAASLGDRRVAGRWAGAVVALWENADPELQPLVTRMRALLR